MHKITTTSEIFAVFCMIEIKAWSRVTVTDKFIYMLTNTSI